MKAVGAVLLAAMLSAGCTTQSGSSDQARLVQPAELAAATPAAVAPSPAAPTPPAITMECPQDEDGLDGQRNFAHSVTALAPYTVDIDYGDGATYRGDQDGLDAVFEHEYDLPGRYLVVATVTDAASQREAASCTFAWTALLEQEPPPAEYFTGADEDYGTDDSSDSSETSADYDSCGSDEYENVDGECVELPDDHASGASARCADGTYSYSQNRRGTCSHHGGVAEWY